MPVTEEAWSSMSAAALRQAEAELVKAKAEEAAALLAETEVRKKMHIEEASAASSLLPAVDSTAQRLHSELQKAGGLPTADQLSSVLSQLLSEATGSPLLGAGMSPAATASSLASTMAVPATQLDSQFTVASQSVLLANPNLPAQTRMQASQWENAGVDHTDEDMT